MSSGAGELRTYATLVWVGKTVLIGYVIVSLSTQGGAGGVRWPQSMHKIPFKTESSVIEHKRLHQRDAQVL